MTTAKATGDDLKAYCLSKPGAWLDQPWEGDEVVKVGDKIFAFLGFGDVASVGVKCDKGRVEADEWLAEFPAEATVMPYLGRHGWNALAVAGAIPVEALREAIDTSYALVVAGLPKSRRP